MVGGQSFEALVMLLVRSNLLVVGQQNPLGTPRDDLNSETELVLAEFRSPLSSNSDRLMGLSFEARGKRKCSWLEPKENHKSLEGG